jgi:hypothetical protein
MTWENMLKKKQGALKIKIKILDLRNYIDIEVVLGKYRKEVY